MKLKLLSSWLILLSSGISNATNETQEEKHILVVGENGVGKSELINFLVGEKKCPEDRGWWAQTDSMQKVTLAYDEKNGQKINLSFYDTPELIIGIPQNEVKVQLKIVNFMAKVKTFSAVIIVIKPNEHILNYYKEFFAPLLKENQVIILKPFYKNMIDVCEYSEHRRELILDGICKFKAIDITEHDYPLPPVLDKCPMEDIEEEIKMPRCYKLKEFKEVFEFVENNFEWIGEPGRDLTNKWKLKFRKELKLD